MLLLRSALFCKVLLLVYCKYHNIIDVDDILDADYMPGNLLMLENPEATVKNFSHDKLVQNFHNDTEFDGGISKALSTMLFHRSKMNEYFCRNYIAEQIIEEISLTRLKRRSGNVLQKKPSNVTVHNHKDYSMLDNMIEDEGSSNYKSWLSKSTTLEDIYKHYQEVENRGETEENFDYDSKNDKHEEFYDENTAGQIPVGPEKVGYGSGPMQPNYGSSGHGPPNPGYSYGNMPSSHGYGHSGPPLTHHEPSGHGPVHVIHETVTHHEHHSSGKDLSELFEIALTALAYLAFGCFIIHVVMCIAHGKKKDHYLMTVIPVTTPSTTIGTVGTAMSGGDMDLGGMDAGGGAAGGDGMNVGMPGEGAVDDTGNGGVDEGGGMTANEGMPEEEPGPGTATGGEPTGGEPTGSEDAGDEGVGEATGGGEEAPPEEEEGGTAPEEDVGMTGEEADVEGGEGEIEGADGDVTGVGVDDTRLFYFSTQRPFYYNRRSAKSSAKGEGTMPPGRRRRKRKKRKKRKTESKEIPSLTDPDTESLNELARHVLTSIEAALVAQQDKGACLRKVLCLNNKYARTLENSNKIWIPVWSLGLSWLAGKLTKDVPPATSMLDSIKASILGLGKANCDVIYQDCDLQKQRSMRRRRRRRK